MIYRVFRSLAVVALHLFFRRIEVEAPANVPSTGPVLFVSNHSNALVDPAVLIISTQRVVTVTAKNVLSKNPLLDLLMRALGVIPFHRREDQGKGADPRQNIRSLRRCRQVLAAGGSICIFPEGVSHSDSKLRSFRLGPARIALDFIAEQGNPGRLQIVPVGLLYTEKDRFRSGVWLRFGAPLDVAEWLVEHPDADPAELTHELHGQVAALTLNYETRRESEILLWAAEIAATRGESPPSLGASEESVADWFRLLERLQDGYEKLVQTDPDSVDELAERIRQHRAELKRTGISPREVYLPIHFGRAALFLIRELELVVVGAPMALFGTLNHFLPYQIVKLIAQKMSTDRDHWASNVIYPSLLVFPLCYSLQLAFAWWLLPAGWAVIYTALLPFTGYYALLYGDRLARSWRRAATFLRFLFRRVDQRRLADEGRAIFARMRDLGARVELSRDN